MVNTIQAEDSIRIAVIDAYRDHLERRYTVENIRRFPELHDFPEEKVHAIRNFFLEELYPDSKDREELELAFEQLGSVLRSPRKLMPLVGTAFSSLWKLGKLIPAAVTGGLRTVEAYMEIRRLEHIMLKSASSNQLEPATMKDERVFAKIISDIPDVQVQRFRKDITKLFQSLANTKLLLTTIDILEHSIQVMEKKEGVYEPRELAGIRVGHTLLTRGISLFTSLNPQEIHMLMTGVDAIEMDWIDRMRIIAAAN